jgi:hypothetical protein
VTCEASWQWLPLKPYSFFSFGEEKGGSNEKSLSHFAGAAFFFGISRERISA